MSVWVRPGGDDVGLVAWAVGRALGALGLATLAPLVVALALREWNAASALAIGASLAIGVSVAASRRRPSATWTWSHGLVAVALAWLVAAVVAAVPMVLSGHYGSPLAALYDAMSALTTTGVTVAHDIDHMAVSLNLHRHLLQVVGAAGVVVAVLAVYTSGGSHVVALAAARESADRLLPTMRATLRFTAKMALTFAAAGTLALTVALWLAGHSPARAIGHALTLTASSLSTGGLAASTASVAAHHSLAVETILVVLMVIGATSFNIHATVWLHRSRDALRNTEARTLATTSLLLLIAVGVGLATAGAHSDASALTRRGAFMLVSALTTTGLRTVSPAELATDWGALAPAALVTAMAIGGMTASTAGGIKAFRIGIVARSLVEDVRRVLLPDAALVVSTYHAGRRRVLREDTARAAATMLLLYVTTFLVGALVALAVGDDDVTRALFDSVAVTTNTGLTVGIVGPDMSEVLMVAHIVQMWLGRLEFVAVLALLGSVVSIVRGRVRS